MHRIQGLFSLFLRESKSPERAAFLQRHYSPVLRFSFTPRLSSVAPQKKKPLFHPVHITAEGKSFLRMSPLVWRLGGSACRVSHHTILLELRGLKGLAKSESSESIQIRSQITGVKSFHRLWLQTQGRGGNFMQGIKAIGETSLTSRIILDHRS